MSRNLSKFAALGLVACCSLGSLHLHAQDQVLSQVQQAQAVQRVRQLEAPNSSNSSTGGDVPSLYPGEESDTGDQLILNTNPSARWKWFNLSLDSQYFYTNNAFLTDAGMHGTGLMVNTLNGEIDIPPMIVPGGQLLTDVGYQYQWFDYGIGGASDNFDSLDFDAATLYANAQYALPNNWSIFANLAYTRLMNDGNGYDEFYKEFVPTLSLQKDFVLGKTLRASLEYSANYHVTGQNPYDGQSRSANNRTDQVLQASLTWQITSKLDLRPFYRFQYSYYPNFLNDDSRNDFLHTFGASVDYAVNSWASIRFFMTYEIMDTDASVVSDYRKLDLGGGLSAGIKF
jgi:hypothetical protein